MIIKLSTDIAINTDDINYILAYSSKTSKDILKTASENNMHLNLTKNKATKSLVCMNNGKVISLNSRIDTLIKKINAKDLAIENITEE